MCWCMVQTALFRRSNIWASNKTGTHLAVMCLASSQLVMVSIRGWGSTRSRFRSPPNRDAYAVPRILADAAGCPCPPR